MKIYNVDHKKMAKYLIKFSKTYYGKIMFLLSYSLPLIFVLASLTAYLKEQNKYLILIFIYAALVSFVMGSINFYKEIKEFINND